MLRVNGSENCCAVQTLENIGTKAFSRSNHNFTYQNENLLGMRDSYGINVTDQAVGCTYGILSLVRHILMALTGDMHVSDVAGESAELSEFH